MSWPLPLVSSAYRSSAVHFSEPLTGTVKWSKAALTCQIAQAISLGPDDTIALSSKKEITVFTCGGRMLWRMDLAEKGGVCVASPDSSILIHTQNNAQTLCLRNIHNGSLVASMDVQVNPHAIPVFSAAQNRIFVNIAIADKPFLAAFDMNLNRLWNIPLETSSKRLQVHVLNRGVFLIQDTHGTLVGEDGAILKNIPFEETCTGAKQIVGGAFLLQFEDKTSHKIFRFFDAQKLTFSDKLFNPDLSLDSSVVNAKSADSFTILCKSRKVSKSPGFCEHRLVRFDSTLKPIWEYRSALAPRAIVVDQADNCFIAFAPECAEKFDLYQRYDSQSLSFLKGFDRDGNQI